MNEDKIITKLIEHDDSLGKIVTKLIEHDDRLERMETKMDGFLTKEEYMNGQDKIMAILLRLDEERIFTMEWVKKIEREVEEQKIKTDEHEEVLNRIKTRLQIA